MFSSARKQGFIGYLKTAALNSTSDQPIIIDSHGQKWTMQAMIGLNPSGTPVAAAGGIYTGASKTGTTLLPAGTTYTGYTPGTTDYIATQSDTGGRISQTATTIYFSLTTPNVAAVTLDVTIYGQATTNATDAYDFGTICQQSVASNTISTTRVTAGCIKAADFNVTTDQPMRVENFGCAFRVATFTVFSPSGSFSTSAGGAYTGASKTGTTLLGSGQTYSSLNPGTTDFLQATTGVPDTRLANTVRIIYFSLTTGQGSAATADVFLNTNPEL